ncbi:MAG: 2-oxoacid:acceptor oxidoreductase subunit alpha [Candidatus Atribacteria bacterium]|nr:2-oxoacid:acceptor oxidoreductase subunit alpha [Candidatus Atribacteria bacterium]
MVDWEIKVGGAAGQGVQTVSEILSLMLKRSGYYVFSLEDYQSRIRGGHTFTHIRLSDRPVWAAKRYLDLLVCLDPLTYQLHHHEVKENGLILGNFGLGEKSTDSHRFISIDFEKEAVQLGNKVFANMIAVGAISSILGLAPELVAAYIEKIFAKKGEEVMEKNKLAFQRGRRIVGIPPVLPTRNSMPNDVPQFLLDGNQALGLGALLAGCTFYSAYPMTPSTGIMNFLASKIREYGIVVEQAEDEIAAVNMALGASYAGARAMTGTSGGGFCLMVEGLGLAAMTEVPIVVINGQRPGPSTGLPTRTSQADLAFVIHAGHDEFPRFVFAPRDPQDAINIVRRAFYLAEKYQVPVIILSDQYLADSKVSYWNLEMEEIPDAPIQASDFSDYCRYALTPSGVSPRAIPGGKALVVVDSDEHDECGHLTEDLDVRVAMHEKRMKKWEAMKKEIRLPFLVEGKEVTLLGWGSSWGVLREAREELHEEGIDAGLVHFNELWPLPGGLREFLEGLPFPIVVENNYWGQLANLLEHETGLSFARRITRYDGRPFLVDELCERVKEVLRNVQSV